MKDKQVPVAGETPLPSPSHPAQTGQAGAAYPARTLEEYRKALLICEADARLDAATIRDLKAGVKALRQCLGQTFLWTNKECGNPLWRKESEAVFTATAHLVVDESEVAK